VSEVRAYPLDQELYRTRPWMAKYAMVHGRWNCIPESQWAGVNLKGKKTEEVYKECLEKGVTWQELLNYKPDDDKIY